MGKINYKKIANKNQDEWKALTREPQKYEALLAGHYSDSNHFVYELLQNAEDECANNVVIEYYSDKLVFYHDGDPFDEADVKGVSSMLMGTKDKNDASSIGRFGMGFKSVFKYTHEPRIYSDDEAFKICNYLLPKEVDDIWNYSVERRNLKCKLSGNKYYYPFLESKHLTKIIVPFEKKNDKGEIVKVSGMDVVKKLQSLNGEILLFLTFVKNLYWIDKTTGVYSKIVVKSDLNDKNLVTCRIDGSSFDKEQVNKYLLFSRIFDHPEMANANVSIAYKVNANASNINTYGANNRIFVYFPTKDDTEVPFLLHGSFETAVSREKLMEPSDFNDDLFQEMVKLIVESMHELKERKLISQNFLRQILIPAFDEERLEGLKKAITDLFLAEPMLPAISGQYVLPEDVYLPVPFGISGFASKQLFKESLTGYDFVVVNDEKGAGFADYFKWLKYDLELEPYTLSDWADNLDSLENKVINEESSMWNELIEFYSFLNEYNEEAYCKGNAISTARYTYSRAGEYESMIRSFIVDAWKKLREAPTVLNGDYRLVRPFVSCEELIYFGSSSEYKTVDEKAVVLSSIAEMYNSLFLICFKLQQFDNFQFVSEKVIEKYVKGDTINFVTDDYDQEYAEDIIQIIKLLSSGVDGGKIRDMLKDAYIIRVTNVDGNTLYAVPSEACPYISDKGIDLKTYFAKVNDNVSFIDEEFYEKNNISLDSLKQLGVYSAVCQDGERQRDVKWGDHWWAQGKYCPNFSVEYWDENVKYISEKPDDELSKKKSAIMLKLLIENYEKLSGSIKKNKNNSYVVEEESYFLRRIKSVDYWLYDKNGKITRTIDISRFDLDDTLYDMTFADKRAYEALGFAKTETDIAVETIEAVSKLPEDDQIRLLKKLAIRHGFILGSTDDSSRDDNSSEENTFDPSSYDSDEFPMRRVKDLEKLRIHVKEQFYCSNPIRYEKVWRQIRTSKNHKSARSYAIGMYTNTDKVIICQMCCKPKPAEYIEAIEMANYDIEMEQFNLCLCKECAVDYKTLRERDKQNFRIRIRDEISEQEISDFEDEYVVSLSDGKQIRFTATHIAEIKEIFSLIDEFGLPGELEDDYLLNAKKDLEMYRECVKEQQAPPKSIPINPLVRSSNDNSICASKEEKNKVRLGDKVRVTVVNTGEKKLMKIDLKYAVPSKLLNHYVGDEVIAMGKMYRIDSIERNN